MASCSTLSRKVLPEHFEAISDDGFNVMPEAWNGRYPYQVKVRKHQEEVKVIENAKKVLSKMGIRWKENLDEYQTKALLSYLGDPQSSLSFLFLQALFQYHLLLVLSAS